MAIGKKTYSFVPGWNQVQIGDKESVQKELMSALGCTYKTAFITKKNKGIVNINLTVFEAVTEIFKRYGVKKNIWIITQNTESKTT